MVPWRLAGHVAGNVVGLGGECSANSVLILRAWPTAIPQLSQSTTPTVCYVAALQGATETGGETGEETGEIV